MARESGTAVLCDCLTPGGTVFLVLGPQRPLVGHFCLHVQQNEFRKLAWSDGMSGSKKLNLTEAGRRIGLSPQTVKRRIDQGRIRADVDTDTDRLVVDEAEVDRYLADRWRPYQPADQSDQSIQSDTFVNSRHA